MSAAVDSGCLCCLVRVVLFCGVLPILAEGSARSVLCCAVLCCAALRPPWFRDDELAFR